MLLIDADLGELAFLPQHRFVDLNKEGVQSIQLNRSDITTILYAERRGDELIITSMYRGGGTGQHTFYLKLV